MGRSSDAVTPAAATSDRLETDPRYVEAHQGEHAARTALGELQARFVEEDRRAEDVRAAWRAAVAVVPRDDLAEPRPRLTSPAARAAQISAAQRRLGRAVERRLHAERLVAAEAQAARRSHAPVAERVAADLEMGAA